MTDPRWTWLFTLMGIVAMYLLTRKNRWGYIVGLTKELIWIPYGFATHQYGFVASGIIFAAVFIRGFTLWSQPDPQPEKATVP
jgi:nicotinamide riboside transporter PnuC